MRSSRGASAAVERERDSVCDAVSSYEGRSFEAWKVLFNSAELAAYGAVDR
jgi:hypothetical protein